ncbi:rhodanese domain-containing protein CG4456 [Drosophila grimshawi]|uniref:Sulfurtransferase n=1 Tax=Drosophila grimshawi TaxID=7222 RepID=B4JS85_DROGR|nr:rhodanese domain-containing protein CG4456 [Drosophila grimshawi]EDV94625.1 GH18596 [Drosophila grimshawi]EDW04625.1 GH25246 [Drosophila grimshawi]
MATYEEVKNIPNEPSKYLFDVRNKSELEETGTLPASINIPLPDLEKALNLPDGDFKTSYGRAKPSTDAVMIFSCKAGGRAARAANLAKTLGFTNAVAYAGSWTEWEQKQAK